MDVKGDKTKVYDESKSQKIVDDIKIWQRRFNDFTFCQWIWWFVSINLPNLLATAAFYGCLFPILQLPEANIFLSSGTACYLIVTGAWKEKEDKEEEMKNEWIVNNLEVC